MRQEAGCRQREIAEKLDRPQSYVSKYEVGERSLDVIEVRDICLAIGVSLEQFVHLLERRLGR